MADIYEERLQQEQKALDKQEASAVQNYNQQQDQLLNQHQQLMQQQQQNVNQWADKQTQLQKDSLAFQEQKIQQQKDQAQKDYLKEQKGAYADYMKESNKYGANAEQMATSGMMNTGYSESSKVSMYNTYQNRVATARESIQKAMLEYDNMMQEARMNNDAILADIAYQQMEQSMKLALEGFNYKSQIVNQKLEYQDKMDDKYYNRYQDTLQQINHEKQQAEEKRKYEEQFAYQKDQDARKWAYQKDQDAKKWAYQQQQDAQQQANWEKQFAYQQKQDAQEQANWEKQFALSQAKTVSSGSSGTKAKNNNTTKNTPALSNDTPKKAEAPKTPTNNLNIVKDSNFYGKGYTQTSEYHELNGKKYGIYTKGGMKYYYDGSKYVALAFHDQAKDKPRVTR